MQNEFFPCELLQHKPGNFSLVFSDFAGSSDYIKSHGGLGGGYSWEALVIGVVEILPVDISSIEFDPESDMFAAASANRLALRFVAAIIKELTINQELMAHAIARAKAGGYFA